MPILSTPTPLVADSFRAALVEFRADGRFGPDDDTELAHSLARSRRIDTDDGFAGYLDELAVRATEETAFRVPSTMLWYVEGTHWLGRLSIRHRLTPQLRVRGGHIGYEVRPSARRRGHATAMLRAALPFAAGLGISPALLTCDLTNTASQKVLTAAGGALHDRDATMLRYLLPTG